MGQTGQAEGWLGLAQATKYNASALHHSHVSTAHLLLNAVAQAAVTYGRVLASYCTISLRKRLPTHTAAIYWLLLHSWLWTHWLEETAHHRYDKNCWWDNEGRKPFSAEQHSSFLLSSHSAPLSLFPFPGLPWGMEMLALTNFYCIGRWSKMVETNAWSELKNSPQCPELHERKQR